MSAVPSIQPTTSGGGDSSSDTISTATIIYIVGGILGGLVLLVILYFLRMFYLQCIKPDHRDIVSLATIYHNDDNDPKNLLNHAQKDTDLESLRSASQRSLQSEASNRNFSPIIAGKKSLAERDSSEKLQRNPSFSSAVKDIAKNRFPPGTVDWFLSSDFTVDFNAVKLLDVLAKGSFGTVYKAIYNGEVTAAKIEELSESADSIEEQVHLLVELTMLQSFPHERLVRFLGATCLANDNGTRIEKKLIIVLELCERGDLRDALRHNLPWNLRVRLSLDVAQGIAFLHDQLIIHRDIKTTNILIDSNWRAKLCDFSFACHSQALSDHKKEMTYGTEEFMSPEIANGLDFDVPADIFSCGIVLCEIMTGFEPSATFMNRRPQDYFMLDEEEVRGREIEGCPKHFEYLAFSCCKLNPGDRPAAMLCVNILEEILQTLNGPDFTFKLSDRPVTLSTSITNPLAREGKVRRNSIAGSNSNYASANNILLVEMPTYASQSNNSSINSVNLTGFGLEVYNTLRGSPKKPQVLSLKEVEL